MAAFLSRTVDGVLKRGSRRAALDQFWTPQNAAVLGLTTVGRHSAARRVRRGGPLGRRTSAAHASRACARATASCSRPGRERPTRVGVLVGDGTGLRDGQTRARAALPDRPEPAAPGAVTTVASNLGTTSDGIAFDGARIWTANTGAGSVSIVTPGATIPWTVTTVTAGFAHPLGVALRRRERLDHGQAPGTLLKLDSAGAILQTVTVGSAPRSPSSTARTSGCPNSGVRSRLGRPRLQRRGPGDADGQRSERAPIGAAFDGQRVLVTNLGGDSVSLWKAADLTPLGSFSTGTGHASRRRLQRRRQLLDHPGRARTSSRGSETPAGARTTVRGAGPYILQ